MLYEDYDDDYDENDVFCPQACKAFDMDAMHQALYHEGNLNV